MSLPSLAPYPPSRFRKELVPEEWEACLDAWLSLSELYLRLGQQEFENAVTAKTSSLVSFLKSYYHDTSSTEQHASVQKAKEHALKKISFIITHRVLLDTKDTPSTLLQWDFLSDFSHAYTKAQSLEFLLQSLWQRKGAQLEASLQDLASLLLKQLELSQPDIAYDNLRRVAPLVHASPNVAKFFMTGSDLMDALSAAYSKGSSNLRESLVTVTYLGISGLTKGEKPNHSLVFDHLYSLRSQAEKDSKSSLLADLVTNTPLLSKLRTGISGKDADRAVNLAAALDKYRTPSLARPKRQTQRRVDNGKGRETAGKSFGSGVVSNEHHVHQMSLITQIQDLFPDLGSAFIARLLDEYNESVEEATAHLLDESLPAHLSALDRTLQLPEPGVTEAQRDHERVDHLAPRSTPPPSQLPERKNVFDNDEFDRLEIDQSRMHIGRKNASLTADAVLSDRTNAPAKSRILAALAAFDSDDDERDDTYDEADVGGTVDAARPDGEDRRDIHISSNPEGSENEEPLFRAYQLDRGVFDRNADVRRGKARQALKSETGMTDETIEGWGLMLGRDPRRLRRLEAKYSAFHGGQNEIARTSYREGEHDDDSEDGAEAGSGFGGRGRGKGRGGRGAGGRGRGGRGGGGRGGASVAGAPNDKGTQIARQRKEARGSSRREGRAKKMARAGFAG